MIMASKSCLFAIVYCQVRQAKNYDLSTIGTHEVLLQVQGQLLNDSDNGTPTICILFEIRKGVVTMCAFAKTGLTEPKLVQLSWFCMISRFCFIIYT